MQTPFLVAFFAVVIASLIYTWSVGKRPIVASGQQGSKLKIDKVSCDVDRFKEDSCFLYENINRNQLIYMKLRKILGKLTPDKNFTLNGQCKRNLYIQSTAPERVLREVNQITNAILDRINQKSGFYFRKVDYDNITEVIDAQGNRNFQYQVFVEDPQEWMQIRLLIDVVKIIYQPNQQNNYPITCTEKTLPAFGTFPIGWPKTEQLIPLPTEVITTGLDVLSTRGIKEDKIPPAAYLYINKLELFNSSLVINSEKKCETEGVCGEYEVSLDHSLYNGPNTPFQEPACVVNKWPELPEAQGREMWNCRQVADTWNARGIPDPVECASVAGCPGLQSSVQRYPYRAEFWPTLATIPRNSGPNSWLFSLIRGDPATEGADFTAPP